MLTLLERFSARLAETPDWPLFTWIDDAGEDERTLTHAQLDRAATALAGRLLGEYGLRSGDRVLLAHPPSLEFVVAFTACLMARIIPAPVPPLRPFRFSQDSAALTAIAASAGARAILTTAANARITQRIASGESSTAALAWYATDDLAREPERVAPLKSAPPLPDDLAFLQYTSGSTSAPKGVAVTYANLSHQLEMHAAAFQLGPETRAVFWMPHYHDFCLIGGVLGALHGNGQVFLLAPDSFIRRPAIWPQVLSRVRATHTGASNFGYEMVVRRTTAEQRAGWDLSALRVAVSAAEPVRQTTAREFVDGFAASGLRPEAFCVAYGLAEHTAAVSLGGRGWRRRDESEIASCGAPGVGVDVRVVDPETLKPVPDGEVGELWVSSASKCAGYYGLAEETRETFEARLSEDGAGYLRTGDLGFLEGGEVYVCGRSKDLIIVRGRNVYPQDVEAAIEASHSAVLAGTSVAFAVPADAETVGEGLVVVAEVRSRRLTAEEGDAIARAVGDAVLRQVDAPCHAVVLVQPGGVPRTTSGKVRRRAARDSYLDGTLMSSPSTLHVWRADDRDSADGAGDTDHRLVRDLDPAFRRLAGRTIDGTYRRATGTRRRAAHGTGIAALGTLRVLDAPGIPAHRLFTPGAEYDVVLRHSSNKGFEDDAVADVRGAALRLLPSIPDSTAASNLSASLLDLVLATGSAFLLPTAEAFVEFALGTPEARLATLRLHPGSDAAIADMMRDPDSFAALEYRSHVTYAFTGLDGVRRLVRYRLTALESPPRPGGGEHARVAPERVTLPLEYAPRLVGDTRPTAYLREDFARRVNDGGVRYCLQLQVRDASEPGAAGPDDALDCTRPWPAERFPWEDVAAITLDRLLDAEAAEALSFDPTGAPADLGVIPARSASEFASINHLRGLAYEASAHARAGRPLPAALEALVREARLPFSESLEGAARALHFSTLRLDPAADLVAQIEALWRSGPLASHPGALEAAIGRLRSDGSATRLGAAPPAPPAATAVGPRFAGTFEHTRTGESDAVLAATLAYDLPCLELLRWRERFSCRLFQDRAELATYLAGTPDVLPAESSFPVAVALDTDTVLAVARYVSLAPERELVIVSEYATALTQRRSGWKIKSVIETDYEEQTVVGAEDGRAAAARYLSRPMGEAERLARLTLAAAGHSLVEALGPVMERAMTLETTTVPAAAPASTGQRVCVVGGGAAGLAAAWELERIGHSVTVLEREDSIAGKAASVFLDGYWHDLGAHLCSNQCRRVYALATEVGCLTEPLVPMRLFDPEARQIATTPSAMFDRQALLEFRATRRELFPTIAQPGLAHAAAGLAQPAAPWLASHRLSALAALETSFTAAGYGQLRDPSLAALYLAKYGELLGLFAEDLTDAAPERFTIKGGFMELWRRVARRLRDVRCGVRIEAIERDATGVRVHTEDGVLEFDSLVLACPLDATPDFLDLGAEERKLFSRIRHNDYYTIVASLQGLPRDGFYLVKHPRDGAHLSVEAGRITAFQHRYPASDVYVCWAYADDTIDPAELQRRLREDVERVGGTVAAIHTYRRWRFFPHFSAEDVAAGAHQRLEALQGQRRTYYTGGLLGFELVEPTVAHAQETIRQHFASAAVRQSASAAPVAAIASTAVPVAPVIPALPVTVGRTRPPVMAANGAFDMDSIERWLVNRVAAAREVPASEIDPHMPLDLYALESLQVVALLGDLSDHLDWRVTPSLLLEFPTLGGVARHLAETIAAATPVAGPVVAVRVQGEEAPDAKPLFQRLGRLFRSN